MLTTLAAKTPFGGGFGECVVTWFLSVLRESRRNSHKVGSRIIPNREYVVDEVLDEFISICRTLKC